MVDLSGIRNIIFDLGGVLLNLDFEATFKAFKQLGSKASKAETKESYANPLFLDFETGMISATVFRQKFHEYLKNPALTDEMIDDAWYAMILDIPKNRVDTLLKIREKINIYLFSNTNDIHITRLKKWFYREYGFEFESLFVKAYYSHEIHERKPDLSSYLKVIELAGIKPKETLFVDDLEKNINKALKTGLKTLWLRDGMEMSEVFG